MTEREYVVLVEKEERSVRGEWKTVTLGEFAPFTYGKGLPVGKRNPSGVTPVFGSNGIVGYHDSSLTDGPTIIIGRKGTVGAVHYSPIPCWPIDTAFFITGNDPTLVKFKYYALSMLGLERMNSDSAVPGLNRSDAHARTLLLPGESEQRAIAHILGTFDDRIELNRRMNETLEGMARVLFKSWFVDFDPVRAKMEGRDTGLPPEVAALFPDRLVDSELGEIPEGWEVKTLGDLCHKPQYGYTASAKEEHVGPKFLRITDINKKAWIDWESVPYCEITEDDLDKYRLYKGDVLIARMADPGHSVVIEESQEVVFASYLIRFRPIHERHTRLLQYWLRSEGYWKLVSGRGAGTTRASLNAKVLSRFPLVVPSVPVADTFEGQIASLRARVIGNASEVRTLAALRDSLLPKLVSGEVRVNMRD